MPCNSDYMNPSTPEVNVSRLYCVIDELDGKTRPSHWWKGHHPEAYGKPTPSKGLLDELVAGVCNRLKVADPKQYSLELQTWWREHQEADAKANLKELTFMDLAMQVIAERKESGARTTFTELAFDADRQLRSLRQRVPTPELIAAEDQAGGVLAAVPNEWLHQQWHEPATLSFPAGESVLVGSMAVGGVDMTGKVTYSGPSEKEALDKLFSGDWKPSTETRPDGKRVLVGTLSVGGRTVGKATMEIPASPEPAQTSPKDSGWKHVMHFHANGDAVAQRPLAVPELPGPPSRTARVWRDLEIGEIICAGDRRIVTLSGRWVTLAEKDPLDVAPQRPQLLGLCRAASGFGG